MRLGGYQRCRNRDRQIVDDNVVFQTILKILRFLEQLLALDQSAFIKLKTLSLERVFNDHIHIILYAYGRRQVSRGYLIQKSGTQALLNRSSCVWLLFGGENIYVPGAPQRQLPFRDRFDLLMKWVFKALTDYWVSRFLPFYNTTCHDHSATWSFLLRLQILLLLMRLIHWFLDDDYFTLSEAKVMLLIQSAEY